MTVPVAFAAGFAAFFSPCVLPLLPVWLAFLGGNKSDSKLKLAINLLFFTAGFALVFTALGATATFLGRLLLNYQAVLTRGAGGIMILFGLQMTGILQLSFLQRKFGFNFKPRQNQTGYFLFGIILAVGWTPCIGIMLGIPCGIWMLVSMVSVENDFINYDAYISPPTYVLVVLITLLFSYSVNLIIGQKFKKIDMIESLKSIE